MLEIRLETDEEAGFGGLSLIILLSGTFKLKARKKKIVECLGATINDPTLSDADPTIIISELNSQMTHPVYCPDEHQTFQVDRIRAENGGVSGFE